MPLFTPSRAVLVLVSILLVTFLWTFGLPHRYATPSLPVISHGRPQEQPLGGHAGPDSLRGTPGGGEGTADAGTLAGSKEEGQSATWETEAVSGAAVSPSSEDVGPEKSCKDARGAAHVMLVVRTSKAEMHKTLPPHLVTLLSCAADFAIFSDYAGSIDGVPVYDALDAIANTTRAKHDEFREYDKLQADAAYRPSVEATKALDKWKFLPMVHKTAMKSPRHRFYVFIEPDTSLSWTNLLQWLDRLDYRIPYYSGVPAVIQDRAYAQAGSGILLSQATLQQYANMYEERYATEWETRVGTSCCGDLVLATAMQQSRVEFYASLPLLQPETPSTLAWTRKHWCSPVVSWYRMSAAENDVFSETHREWTRKHGWAAPYVHRNTFLDFVSPHLADRMEDWDNVSSDTLIKGEPGTREILTKQVADQHPKRDESDAPKLKREAPTGVPTAADSVSNCQSVCQDMSDCLQWKYTARGDGECHLGTTLRLGQKVESQKDGDKWTSGWMVERVRGVTEEWGRCEDVEWKFDQ